MLSVIPVPSYLDTRKRIGGIPVGKTRFCIVHPNGHVLVGRSGRLRTFATQVAAEKACAVEEKRRAKKGAGRS